MQKVKYKAFVPQKKDLHHVWSSYFPTIGKEKNNLSTFGLGHQPVGLAQILQSKYCLFVLENELKITVHFHQKK